MQFEYIEKHREGDHICYISDLTKMKTQYPGWNISKTLNDIFIEIYEAHYEKGIRRTILG